MTAVAPGDTPRGYGATTRALHWLTALLVLVLLPLGLLANRLSFATDAEIARTFLLFSAHKTLGIVALLIGLLRLHLRLTRPRPGSLHPERAAETFVATAAHWALAFALILVPLAGWFAHAANPGLAPIRWPFGQTLPFIGTEPGLAAGLGAVHRVFAWTLVALLALHVAGVLRHVLIDRDATLARMLSSSEAGPVATHASPAPWLAAVALWALSLALGLLLGLTAAPDPGIEAEWPIAGWDIGLTEDGSRVASLPTLSGLLSIAPGAGRDGKGTLDLTFPLDALEGPGAGRLLAELPFPVLQFLATVSGDAPDLAAEGTTDLAGLAEPGRLAVRIDADGARISGTLAIPGAPRHALAIAIDASRP